MASAFTARLIAEPGVEIGQERIVVDFADGGQEELRLHDYARVYALRGLYEEIVQERLGCRSPEILAGMLAAAVDGCGWERGSVGVIDIAAGNGVSGEALAADGLRPLLGIDIVDAAREAALRDRPGLYDRYLTLDLLALPAAEREALAGLRCAGLSCVAPVGEHASQVPPAVLAAAAALLADDALVVYMHEPRLGVADVVTERWWAAQLPVAATELARERYVHRRLVSGEPYLMDGVVWRLRRA